MAEKYLSYRGDLKAIAGQGNTVLFVTVHPEGQPTAVYRLNAEELTLAADPLPGGVALIANEESVWIAGGDQRLYYQSPKQKAPTAFAVTLEANPTALCYLSANRLGVFVGKQLLILSIDKKKILQTLELPEVGTALAADASGTWIAAGTEAGTISVFEGEEKDEFLFSESAKVHQGAVTALLFEPEELRFYSAGLDQKLFLTHARGKLEPEDRGRGANHEDRVTAMILGAEDRMYTGARDGSVKSWVRGTNQRPATQRDGVAKVVGMAMVTVHKRPQLALACEDNTIRLLTIDGAGKAADLANKIYDAYDAAEHELAQSEVTRREQALNTLAEFADTRSIEILARRIREESDHKLSVLATQLLGKSGHPRAGGLLEKELSHSNGSVRLVAFEALQEIYGKQELRILDAALKVRKADVGCAAVEALRAFAEKNDQALTRLQNALNFEPLEVRKAALLALETVYDKDSPEPNLVGLQSKHSDVRVFALLRLLHRELIGLPEVQAALRRRCEDDDARVRRSAFLILLLTREKLATAIRARDTDLHRHLHELETYRFEEETKESTKEVKLPKVKATKFDLEAADYDPLLQAIACRSIDICLLGGRCLALLGDPRAFGLLLQLSREEDPAARVEVCKALAALDDPRSVERLSTLLYDQAAEVRDAAFSALAHIHSKQPLRAAEYGFGAPFEDVRQRGLQLLVQEIRQKLPKTEQELGWQLLLRALNDSFEKIRSEAFKATLNLKIAGGGAETLRFALQAVYEDIRREVLTEAMGQLNQAWARPLLLEFFDDPAASLRQEAFEFLHKKSKRSELDFLERALESKYPNMRFSAVDALSKRPTKKAQLLLVKALDDTEWEVRNLALDAILSEDAQTVLAEALTNQHTDVVLRAAKARALHGDSAAREPLLRFATEEEPREKEKQRDWRETATSALQGLGTLGDPTVFEQVQPLVQSKHGSIRQAAAQALVDMTTAEHQETLRTLLQHEDAQVKYRAAFGLALAGDQASAPLVFSLQAAEVLSEYQRLAAGLLLGPAGEDYLVSQLDRDEAPVRKAAFFLLLLLELAAHDGTPRRCLACLSSRFPKIRLLAGEALQQFANREDFLAFVVATWNDREDQTAWKIPAEVIENLASLIAFAPPQIRTRTVGLFAHLDAEKQEAWDQAWEVHSKRFADALAMAKQAAQQAKTELTVTAEQLNELAFGAYVGLVRETQITKSVRQAAIRRLGALATEQPAYQPACASVFVQTLGDPNAIYRLQAFECLKELKYDTALLATEALQCGYVDLGVAGLSLLKEGVSAKQGREILRNAMLTRSDDLAIEAAKLLLEEEDNIKVASQALEATHQAMRVQAVTWLMDWFDDHEEAPTALRKALASRYRHVREMAAVVLANKKDAAAFDALVELLGSEQRKEQNRAIRALDELGDPRVPNVLLDRLENDPSKTAQANLLLEVARNYRQPECVPRLLQFMDRDELRQGCFSAVLTISGYDQPNLDPDDDQPDQSWLEKQHPRHDDVLAKLLEKCIALGMVSQAMQLIEPARWSKSSAVDSVLATLTFHANAPLREQAVQAMGWRLKHREGPAEPLVHALEHPDGSTKFYAAEGLARAGRAEGINILLAGVELLTDFSLRRRAVLALGELADERALDVLLKFANEEGHALQEAAAEAIGHLGQSSQAEDIFKLLKQLASHPGGLGASAIQGLRWFNTRDAWTLLREYAREGNYAQKSAAIAVLGHNDDAATKDLLLELIEENRDYSHVGQAFTAARRLFGEDSLAPDLALLKSKFLHDDFYASLLLSSEKTAALERVCNRGRPQELLELLPFCEPETLSQVQFSLLGSDPLPVEAAAAVLESPHPATVQTAARILGRSREKVTKQQTKNLEQAFERWRSTWHEERNKLLDANDQDHQQRERLTSLLTPTLRAIIWALGQFRVGADGLLAALSVWPDDGYYQPIRNEVLQAMAHFVDAPAVIDALQAAAIGSDPQLRAKASMLLAQANPQRITTIADDLLSDPVSFQRTARVAGEQLHQTIQQGVAHAHYQSIALPEVVAQQDIPALVTVMNDDQLPDSTRLGAIEGLARMAIEDAEVELVTFANSDHDEELRKAAWRARRRSQRRRKPPSPKPENGQKTS